MTSFFANLSLSKRYALFLFVVISVLLTASHIITSTLFSDGMRELYRQRLQRCESTLSQYANVHFVTKASEIEAIVTSPRFVAAVATADNQTIANEAPYYIDLLGATVFVVQDASGELVYGFSETGNKDLIDSQAKASIAEILTEAVPEIKAHYIRHGNDLLELFDAEIVTHDGLYVGRLIAGTDISNFLVDDLERMTGLNIIVTYDNTVVAHSATDLANLMLNAPNAYLSNTVELSQVRSFEFGGLEVLSITESDERLNITVTFLGLPDEQIAPIMSHVRTFLIGLALFSGTLALIVVYYYTSRRIGQQIDILVQATNSISRGNLDFELQRMPNDEFGTLSSAIDKMRTNLKLNRDEITSLHHERIQSERLTSIGQSATGIIHDFKSPMAIIRGTIELLSLKRKDDADLVQRLQTMTDQIDQMNQLSQDVIEFSRGKFMLSIEPVRLLDYFSNIRSAQIDSFDNSGIKLTIDALEEYEVKMDPARFRRVIDNILNNAREALKPGQHVGINWELIGQELHLTIADNGPGIPKQILETIFDPFVTSGKETGTGLGLAIAKKIVEDHNATIDVESDPNVGTVFRIRISETMVSKVNRTTALIPEEI